MRRRVGSPVGKQARLLIAASTPAEKKSKLNQQTGFTLIELITVIVILGIISVIGSQFIVSATESYRATQSRALLTNTGRQAVERMTRQLRGALPYSVRVTNSGDCIQFMPIAAAGFYLQPVSSTTASGTLNTSPYSVAYFTADYLVLGALGSTEIYDGSVRANVTGTGATSVSFASRTWPRNSVAQRFYLVSMPQAFCLTGNQLRFYEGLNPAVANVNTAGASELLARNASAAGGAAFVVSGATAENNILASMAINFSEGGESVDFFQEVSLRNVP